MIVKSRKEFDKKFLKLRANDQQRTVERLKIFSQNPVYPLLNNHALKGKYLGYWSINITGDLRAVYKLLNPDAALFVDIDTHSNLYK